MKHAETVTFGGSGLNRAADLRGNQAALRGMDSSSIVLWRGKPLVTSDRYDSLCRVPMDHPVLQGADMPPILLGQEENGALVYSHDISAWVPDGEGVNAGFLDTSEQMHPAAPGDTVFAELRRIMAHLSTRDAELAAAAKAVSSWHISHKFCARCGAQSAMAMSGWQRNCPSCSAQHFPRTDPVVIMLITRGNSVLLGRSHGWPEGMYSLLAGFVEPGETMEAAVRREVFEEAGINVGAVTYLASQPWAFPSSLMLGCHGTASSEIISIDPGEIEDAIWFTREDIMQAFAGQHPFLLPARKGAIAHFLLHNWLADSLK